MNVGNYVRTKCYGIQRITGFISDLENDYIDCDYDETTRCLINKKEIIKYSPNIIDLIEIGDYVNGMLVTNIWIYKETDNIEFEFNNHESYLYPKSWNYESRVTKYKIKSIVTKEQFEAMQYKVGE